VLNGTVVIVGASVGGVQTALSLRDEEYTGEVILVGAESGLPYDRPPLSKQFLTGTWDEEKFVLLSQEAAREKQIEMRLGCPAVRLDTSRQVVVLESGQEVSYDCVVIATGAYARPSPWEAASGVYLVRTLEDSRRLSQRLCLDEPVVVVGGGFIGAEVAAAARSLGREVTIVDPLPHPIVRVVGVDIGTHFRTLHQDQGVRARFGVGVEAIEGTAGDLRVHLADGEVLQAGTVVVGIGAIPCDGWLQGSGVMIDDGVVCDHFGRAINGGAVYAVGDVARWFRPRQAKAVRSEHWTNASDQASCVAHNIAHPEDLRELTAMEYVWSDQYDWKIQIVGRPAEAAATVAIGDTNPEAPRFAALSSDGQGRLNGAVTVNWPKALFACRKLLRSDASFEEAKEVVGKLPAGPSNTRAPSSSPVSAGNHPG
jgi:phthalate 3,4-dioxygenase ferredoxin reductase component